MISDHFWRDNAKKWSDKSPMNIHRAILLIPQCRNNGANPRTRVGRRNRQRGLDSHQTRPFVAQTIQMRAPTRPTPSRLSDDTSSLTHPCGPIVRRRVRVMMRDMVTAARPSAALLSYTERAAYTNWEHQKFAIVRVH